MRLISIFRNYAVSPGGIQLYKMPIGPFEDNVEPWAKHDPGTPPHLFTFSLMTDLIIATSTRSVYIDKSEEDRKILKIHNIKLYLQGNHSSLSLITLCC
jgi:hypothetical protein